MPKNIILMLSPKIQAWGSLKPMCDANDMPYWTLARFKYPIKYKKWIIFKIPYNQTTEIKNIVDYVKIRELCKSRINKRRGHRQINRLYNRFQNKKNIH